MPTLADWPLTGRDDEFRVLLEILGQGQGSVVLAGEAGVGKTRLHRELLSALEEAGRPVRRAIATATAASIPFGALAHHLSEPPQSQTDRFGLLRRAIASLTEDEHGMAVLSVDDAHLLDDLSATLLHQLAASGQATLLLTVRSGEVAPDAIVSLWKEGYAQRLELQPLSRQETEELIRSTLGGTVATHTLARLTEGSGGNPLFLREILLGALEGGALHKATGVWMWTTGAAASPLLREVVASRMAGLPSEQLRALEVLALGEPLEPAMFQELSSPVVLAELERGGLVTEVRHHDRVEVRLVHPVYAEALRATIAPQDARAALTMLVEAHECSESTRSDDLLRMALWHLDAGVHDRPELLCRAAEHPLVIIDPHLRERLARAAAAAEPTVRAALSLAAALQDLARFDEAIAVARPMIAEATSDAELANLADVLSFSLLFGPMDGDEALQVLVRAEGKVTDPKWRDWLRARRGNVLFNWGRPQESLALSLDRCDDPSTDELARLVYIGSSTWVLALSGRAGEALALTDRHMGTLLDLAERAPFQVTTAFSARITALAMHGRLSEALEVAGFVHQLAGERRNDNARMRSAGAMGRLNVFAGFARRALKYAEEAMAYAGVGDVSDVVAWFGAMEAEALALLGDPESARSVYEKVRPGARATQRIYGPDFERAEGWVLAAAGEHSAARSAAVSAAESARCLGYLSWEMLARFDAVRLGATELAADLIELCEGVQGELAQAIGVYATGLRNDDGDTLAQATDRLEEVGLVLAAAEASALAARVYERAGLRARASSAAARSRALVDRCEGATTPILQAAQGPDPLTRREREVATLAAHGLSNKHIADRLVTSVRTVEGHLHQAYAKLGVTSRSELGTVLGVDPPTAKPSHP